MLINRTEEGESDSSGDLPEVAHIQKVLATDKHKKEEAKHLVEAFKKYPIKEEKGTYQTSMSTHIITNIVERNTLADKDKDGAASSSQYSQIDLEEVRAARLKEWKESSEDKVDGLEVYMIPKKKKQLAGVTQEEEPDDLVKKFQLKMQGQLQMTEQLRDRQARIIMLSQLIRDYDLRRIRQLIIDELKALMLTLNTHCKQFKLSIEQKIKFCNYIRSDHDTMVKQYRQNSELFDQHSFKTRIMASIDKLVNSK